ncbi:sensor histidine kinase [Hanstruepera marina]|uniref:sensor histidine kinase n=1 Tax=Hanstruepera marina TaxID=2873265 RepID=UPI001CA650EA|nr:histidine kinase [Hanstruepera marina]
MTSNLIYAQNSINRKSTPLHFEVYKTELDTLSISDVLSNLSIFNSTLLKQEITHPSLTYWMLIDFEKHLTTISKDTLWFLKMPKFEHATLYKQTKNGLSEEKYGRFEFSEKDRSVLYGAGIPFKPENLIYNRYLILKLKRTAYISNISNWKIGFASTHVEHLTRYYYSTENIKRLAPYYIFSGICIIMFFLTLAFYIYSQRQEFLYYMLYVLFLLLYLNSEVFKLHEVFFGSYGLLSYAFFQISQMAINLCYILFIIHYLNTKTTYKRLHVALKAIAYLLVFLIILDAFFFGFNYLIGHIYLLRFEQLIMTVFGLVGMIYLIWKSVNKLAYFVVIGSFFYMAGALALLFFSDARYMIAGSTLEVLIFASGLAYKIQEEFKQKLRYQEEAIRNKNKALRAQINPHFIFNALSSIQHFITDNNKTGALKYLSKFSRLTRNILESSMESRIVLSDEIKMINDYLALEALRFDNSFKYEIIIAPKVEQDIIEIPMLIIQPFIENAIIHGLLNKKSKDKSLVIKFNDKQTYLECIIDDNGIGREAAQKFKRHTNKSRGLEVTEERLKTNNQSDCNIEVIDKYDANNLAAGTRVIIKINY